MRRRADEDPAPYRVRERRAPAVWLPSLEAEETLRARPAPRPPPRRPAHLNPLIPPNRTLLILGLVLVAGATTGLVLEHNLDWYTYDLSWIEGVPEGFEVPPDDRALVVHGAEAAENPYLTFSAHAPTWAWSLLIAVGAGLLVLEPLPLRSTTKNTFRILFLGAGSIGGAILMIAASRLIGAAASFATYNEGWLQQPTWLLYVMLLAGIASLAACIVHLLPLVRERLDGTLTAPGARHAATTAFLLAALGGVALAGSPWLAYAISDAPPDVTPVLTDAALTPTSFGPGHELTAAAAALDHIRTAMWLFFALGAVPILLAAASPFIAQRIGTIAVHFVALTGPIAVLATVQAIRALLKIRAFEDFGLAANHVLLAASIIALGLWIRYLARAAAPALAAAGRTVTPVEPAPPTNA